ncbi:MAG: hexapeptide repeat-containing transferase [Polyangiaceae bacterium]|jgi:acetyltransferase-like isoleucine patch superfamily enzyme|nr:hexapeptide repeat-containing transferase [Polyangiaceae bacterium]
MNVKREEPKERAAWLRAMSALAIQFVGIHPRLHAYNVATSILPLNSGNRLRAKLLRGLGFDVGEGTEVRGPMKISGPRGIVPRLSIGQNCRIEAECLLELSDALRIGDSVTLEPGVMILTSTHELDFPQHRAGKIITKPVSVGDGAWLRARAIVLPGVNIGAGAIVETGAVVNKDVAPNTRVGGSPAVKLEALSKPNET